MMRLVLAWLALMLLFGVELVSVLLHAGWLAWAAAPLMIGIVALAFMHAASESPLSRIFAVTGLVWIAILLSLGATDFLVRTNVPVPLHTDSASPR